MECVYREVVLPTHRALGCTEQNYSKPLLSDSSSLVIRGQLYYTDGAFQYCGLMTLPLKARCASLFRSQLGAAGPEDAVTWK